MNKYDEKKLFYFLFQIDNIVEKIQLRRGNLQELLYLIKEELEDFSYTQDLFLLTNNEKLKLEFLYTGEKLTPSEENILLNWAQTGYQKIPKLNSRYLFQILDLQGKILGIFGFIFPEENKDINYIFEQKLLYLIAETIDNFIGEHFFDNVKHQIQIKISNTLEEKIIFKGLEKTTYLLREFIDFDNFFIFYLDKFNEPNYFFYNSGKIYDSYLNKNPELEKLIKENCRSILEDKIENYLTHFKNKEYLEEFLLEGITVKKAIGKFVISSSTSNFNPFEKKLLENYLSVLKYRIIDFNREWIQLSRYFSPSQILKLLETDDYESKFLSPRTEEVAILYADLSSFTLFSEQVLKKPHLITELINIWAMEAMKIIWKNQGILDKLLGDCVIGLFGPPFYQLSPLENIYNAIKTGLEIKKMTKELLEKYSHRKSISLIKQSPYKDKFGVGTGINHGRVNVGILGPDKDFTCFGSVMNNASRLQDKAQKDEILVFKEVLEKVKDKFEYEGPFVSEFKNVSQPQKYYKIINLKQLK